MKIVTTVKHWQIFATVFGIGLLEELFVDEQSELLSDIIYLTWIVIYIGWILVLGSVHRNYRQYTLRLLPRVSDLIDSQSVRIVLLRSRRVPINYNIDRIGWEPVLY